MKKFTKEERIANFWRRVNIKGLVDCWEFTGGLFESGYGQVSDGNRKPVRAHRYAWEIVQGPIPKGKYVLHKCDNRKCVNPNHLYIGTHADNMRDREKRNPRSQAKGEAHGFAKLTDVQVREIRELLSGALSLRKIASKFGVTNVAIWQIKHRKTWTHVT